MEQSAPRVLTKIQLGPQVRWLEIFGPNQFLQKAAPPGSLAYAPEYPMGPIRQEVAKNFPAQKFFRGTAAHG
jgi:hypothetical protein